MDRRDFLKNSTLFGIGLAAGLLNFSCKNEEKNVIIID